MRIYRIPLSITEVIASPPPDTSDFGLDQPVQAHGLCTPAYTGVLHAVLLALLLGPTDLRAAAECSDTPAAGNWIEYEKNDATGACDFPACRPSSLNHDSNTVLSLRIM